MTRYSLADINNFDIKIVGEYTTAAGPFADDWFLVLVNENRKWVEISYDIPDIDDYIDNLNRRLQTSLIGPSLANSSTFNSIITYPASLAGKKLFELAPQTGFNPPRNKFQIFLHGLGIGSFNYDMSISLTQEVTNWLDRASR